MRNFTLSFGQTPQVIAQYFFITCFSGLLGIWTQPVLALRSSVNLNRVLIPALFTSAALIYYSTLNPTSGVIASTGISAALVGLIVPIVYQKISGLYSVGRKDLVLPLMSGIIALGNFAGYWSYMVLVSEFNIVRAALVLTAAACVISALCLSLTEKHSTFFSGKNGQGFGTFPSWLLVIFALLFGIALAVIQFSWARALPLVLGATAPAQIAFWMTTYFYFSLGGVASAFLMSKGVSEHSLLRGFLVLSVSGLGMYKVGMESIATLNPWLLEWLSAGLHQHLLVQFFFTGLVVGPCSFGLGGVFPLMVQQGKMTSPDIRLALGLSGQSIGYSLGSWGATYGLLPSGGPERGLLFGLFVLMGLLIHHVLKYADKSQSIKIVGPALAVALIAIRGLRGADPYLLTAGTYYYAPMYRQAGSKKGLTDELKSQKIVYDKEGSAARLTLWQSETGITSLRMNGRSEAGIPLETRAMEALAEIPFRYAPKKNKSVLLIGMGGGATARRFFQLGQIAHLDCVDIEPLTLDSAKILDLSLSRFWEKSSFQFYVNDARAFLRTSAKRYDIITSQPSAPWVSGSTALFTRESMSTVRKRLAPQGVYCHWLNAYAIDEGSFKALTAAVLSVFESVLLFHDGGAHFYLLATTNPAIENVCENQAKPLLNDEQLRAFVGKAVPYSDRHPYLEYKLIRNMHEGLNIDLLNSIHALSDPNKRPPSRSTAISQPYESAAYRP